MSKFNVVNQFGERKIVEELFNNFKYNISIGDLGLIGSTASGKPLVDNIITFLLMAWSFNPKDFADDYEWHKDFCMYLGPSAYDIDYDVDLFYNKSENSIEVNFIVDDDDEFEKAGCINTILNNAKDIMDDVDSYYLNIYDRLAFTGEYSYKGYDVSDDSRIYTFSFPLINNHRDFW